MSGNQHGMWFGPPKTPDEYELKSQIGAGAEGEVAKAVSYLSAEGRTTYAVKMMPPATGAPSELEADHGKLLRALQHQGLPRVIDIFTGMAPHRRGEQVAGEMRYVVMSYVEGPTLREYIDENSQAKASERMALLRGPAAAIDALHSGANTGVPVVHGDIKPQNIVVDVEDKAGVLVDLGLARLVDGPGRVGLSTAYAAPERREPGSLATIEGDNYSFIVTVASVMTGRPPPTDTDGFLDLEVLRSQLVDSSAVTAQRPGLVMAIVDALRAPPSARPTSLVVWMDGASDQMSAVVTVEGVNVRTGEMPAGFTAGTYGRGGLPPVGPTATRLENGTPPRRGNRKGALVGAALAVVLLLLLTGFVLTRGGNEATVAAATATATVAPTTTTVEPTTTTTTLPTTVPTTTTIRPTTTTAVSVTSAGTGTAFPSQPGYLATDQAVENSNTNRGMGQVYITPQSASTNGVIYHHAINVIASCGSNLSWVDYNLGRSSKTLTMTVGLSDSSSASSSGTWSVLLDGVVKATGSLQIGIAGPVNLDSTGVLRVRLQMTRPEKSTDCYKSPEYVTAVFGDPTTTS